jgi:hypothetical protein
MGRLRTRKTRKKSKNDNTEEKINTFELNQCLAVLVSSVPLGASSSTSHNLVCRIQLPCKIDLHSRSVEDFATTTVAQTYLRHSTTFLDSDDNSAYYA